jgi:hypothetical protein
MAIAVPIAVAKTVATAAIRTEFPKAEHTSCALQTVSQLSKVNPRHTMLVRRESLKEKTMVYTMGMSKNTIAKPA